MSDEPGPGVSNVVSFEKHLKRRLCDWRDERVAALMVMPIDQVTALWDRCDGVNAPDGYGIEDIHMVLNLRGQGEYCAV